MSRSRFARVKQILAEALEQPLPEQEAFVLRACAGDTELASEVMDLLAYSDDARDITSMESAHLAQAFPDLSPTLSDAHAPSIAGYRIVRTIGAGGMGTVFEAEQDQPKRRVAIKTIRSAVVHGDSIRQRFALEAEILGRLSHPAIAKVFDAGAVQTEGGSVPYFVMELVDGQHVDSWVQSTQPDARALMQQVLRICEGVQHAHQNGVIHRDLKPGNILIDADSMPRILDFGIARVTSSDLQNQRANTQTGQIMGTLDYVSPEQISGQPNALDTRSDIYSLGVITYELLAGQHPLPIKGKALPALIKTITEVSAAPLRSIVPECSVDLALIIEKALDKDKTRRYASVSAFADDIQRWLDGEAVMARPPSALYLLQRYAARHRVVVAAALIILLTLIAGIVGIAWKAQEARNERDRTERARKAAVREADIARASVKVLKDGIIAAAHPDVLGPDARIKDVFIHAAESLDQAYDNYPEVDEFMRTTLTDVWIGLGLLQKAESDAERVVRLRRSLYGEESLEVANALSLQAEILEKRSRYADAASAARKSLAILESLPEANPSAKATALTTLGWTQRSQGHYEEAKESMLLALKIRRALHPDGHEDLAVSLNDLAVVLQDLRQFKEAERTHQECIAIRERIHGTTHTKVAQTRNNLGLLYRSLGQKQDAAEEFQQVIQIHAALGIKEHPHLASAYFNLSLVLEGDEKLDACRKAYDMAAIVHGENSFERFHFGHGLAVSLNRKGKHQEALALIKAAIEGATRILGKNHPRLSYYYLSYSYPLAATKQYVEAETNLREALRIVLATKRPKSQHLVYIYRDLASVLQTQEKFPDAEAYLLKAHALSVKLQGESHSRSQDLITRLIKLTQAWDQPEKTSLYQSMLRKS